MREIFTLLHRSWLRRIMNQRPCEPAERVGWRGECRRLWQLYRIALFARGNFKVLKRATIKLYLNHGRDCKVDRLEDKRGACNTGRKAIVSSAFPHFGEESVLQGWNGSGTIFFGMCNLRCVFCQNWDISQQKNGWELKGEEIADLMLKLQNETKCHNINFVTPEHVVPQVIEAIGFAVEGGLRVPIVYNTSAYDSSSSLALLDGLIDIYMPDFKFWESETALRLCKARDYPEVTRGVISEMHRCP